MRHIAARRASVALLCSVFLYAGCATTDEIVMDEEEPVILPEVFTAEEVSALEEMEEVPLTSVTDLNAIPTEKKGIAEIVVTASTARERHEEIRDLVAEARILLSDVPLEYVFTGKGGKEKLRGRPVVFALWSEHKKEWSIASLEVSIPAKWKPGGSPLSFRLLSKEVKARHVWGTGAERLMFRFSKDGEHLKVYGRKFPVFDNNLLKKRRWREVVETASPITYLPFTKDAFDPAFISGGEEYLLSTSREAMKELCVAGLYSLAFPGKLLCEVTTPEVIATLAVIEQTDDYLYVTDPVTAVDEVLSHYGLKREEAYRFSTSRAQALGPMQFTNWRNNGTYARVVEMCPGAGIDPDFYRGAVNLKNAMKAAVCLFDIELSQMRSEITRAYLENMDVLGIFPVAAYNGGPKNVMKLYAVIRKMGLSVSDLRAVPEEIPKNKGRCPCLWKEGKDGVVPVSIPRYNNENRGYIEKYQKILRLFNSV